MVSPYLLKPLRSLDEARAPDTADSGGPERAHGRHAPVDSRGPGGRPESERRTAGNGWTAAASVAAPVAEAPPEPG